MTERSDFNWNSGAPNRMARILYWFGRSSCVVFCHTVLWASVTGRENIPAEGGFILAPVHRSNLDTPIAAIVTRRCLRYMGKDSIWKSSRLIGWVMSSLGGFPVARGRSVADREALKRCQLVLTTGQPLVLFPEGTRRHGPIVLDLFEGPAYLAMKAQVPIVPMGIGGSELAQAKGTKRVRPSRVRVVIGKPIPPPPRLEGKAGRAGMSATTETLRRDIQQLFDEAQAYLGL